MELKKWVFADAVPSSPLAAGPHVADTGRRIACTDVAVRPGGAVADRAGSPGRDAGRDNVRDDATARVPAGARGACDMSSAQRPASSCPPGPAMPRLRARSRRGCFPLLQRGLAAVLRRNVPVPDASPEAESGGAGRPGALAGRVRRAAALVFCASLAAPLLGAGGSAEAQNTPPTLTSADVEETNGLSIDLEFSEDLQLSNPPPASAFTLTVDGSAVTGFSVAWQGSLQPQNAIWLVLPTAIRQGQVVVVTYEDPTAGDDANAIQDTAGNDAATFTTGMDGVPAVTNNSTVTNTPATGAPTITGTAQVGQTLTAGTTAIMDDDGLTSVSYTYQWIRVATDNTETNISGATASTYTLVAADQGTTVKVRVSFTDDASKAETRTSAATAAVSAAPNTPATGAPTITGTAQVGQTLTAGTTAIVDADGLTSVSYTYQWIRVATDNTETNISRRAHHAGGGRWARRGDGELHRRRQQRRDAHQRGDGGRRGGAATGAPTMDGHADDHRHHRRADRETNIASATVTYTLVAADQGTTIKVTVSFTDDASNAETLTSAATAAVAAAPNTPATGAPTITGTAQVGQTLTAGTTAIMDADGLTSVSYTYQWIRVATDNTETNISGATASTYTLVAADQGTTVKVTVSFTDDANNPETLTSAATAAVAAAANTPATGAPTITGTAQVGQTLTAGTTAIMDADGLTSVSYTYQWIRVATDNTETNISSATASAGGGRPGHDGQGDGELHRRRQ